MLDETTAEQAMRNPEAFRAQTGEALLADLITLRPYALVRIDSRI